MRWPWVSRRELDAVQERLSVAETREQAARTVAAEMQRESTLERQRLTDRILQLSGQPPIYRDEPAAAKVEAPKQEPAKPASRGPVPVARARITADSLHEKFREAVASGQVDTARTRIY